MPSNSIRQSCSPTLMLLFAIGAVALPAAASQRAPPSGATAQPEPVVANPKLDRSGKTRKGKASYYAPQFSGKKMANGKPLNLREKVAASKTLPLGTVAKVTNLETGKSEVVTIEDRGPYVEGRIVDVSPSTAASIGLKKDGVAPVAVKPLAVPPVDTVDKDQKR
jgi:rare lipoprotein A